MRHWGALVFALALAGCGTAVPESRALPAPSPGLTHQLAKDASLSCGKLRITYGEAPADLERAKSFSRIASVSKKFKVKGVVFGSGESEMRIGVVCGVKSAQQFATLVSRSRLTMHDGRPALRWRTRGDVRHFMWLDRPGIAVYISATPGLADHVAPFAGTVG